MNLSEAKEYVRIMVSGVLEYLLAFMCKEHEIMNKRGGIVILVMTVPRPVRLVC